MYFCFEVEYMSLNKLSVFLFLDCPNKGLEVFSEVEVVERSMVEEDVKHEEEEETEESEQPPDKIRRT